MINKNTPVSVIESGWFFDNSLIVSLFLWTDTGERCSLSVILPDLIDLDFTSIVGLVDVTTFTLLLTLTVYKEKKN